MVAILLIVWETWLCHLLNSATKWQHELELCEQFFSEPYVCKLSENCQHSRGKKNPQKQQTNKTTTLKKSSQNKQAQSSCFENPIWNNTTPPNWSDFHSCLQMHTCEWSRIWFREIAHGAADRTNKSHRKWHFFVCCTSVLMWEIKMTGQNTANIDRAASVERYNPVIPPETPEYRHYLHWFVTENSLLFASRGDFFFPLASTAEAFAQSWIKLRW